MDPFTITLAAIAGGGKLFEGFAGSAAAELQGEIAAENTRLLEKQAEIQELGAEVALQKGLFEQSRLSDRISRVIAAQPGRYAASGLSSTTVSPLVAAAFSASQGEADLEILRANALLEAAAAKTQAANTRGQAAASSYQEVALHQRAFNSRVSGIFGAATAFMSAGKGGFGNPFAGDGAGSPLDINSSAQGPYTPGSVGTIFAPANYAGMQGLY